MSPRERPTRHERHTARESPREGGSREHRWAIGALAHPLAEHTLDGWRALPPDARRRWLVGTAIALLVACAASGVLALVMERRDDAGRLGWDRELLEHLVATLPMTFHDGTWVGGLGSTPVLVPLVFVAAFLLVLHDRVLDAFTAVASYFLAKPVILAGWGLWDRARPDFVEGGIGIPASLHAFPSGHVLQTTTVYGWLVWLWISRSRSAVERTLAVLLFLALVTIQAAGRLRIGAHWPSDVVAGFALGLVLLGGLIAARRAAAERGDE